MLCAEIGNCGQIAQHESDGAKILRLRDKLMQTENSYDKEVFNGDIGQVVNIDPDESR
jgi:ATP-dependent exoDNAse (exonuclease V) alpha subunit